LGRLRKLRSTIVLASALIAIMIVSTMASAAETYYVGVYAGAWAKYDINFQYVWESQTEPEPQYLRDSNQTKWNNVTIAMVSGYTVTTEVTTHLKNNTERTARYQGDILTGVGNLSFQVLVAGIQKGDPILIYPNFTGEIPRINETISTSYAGANRQINFMRVEAGDVKNGEFLGSGVIYDYYWDRKTGILCELGTLTHDETALHNMTSYLTAKMAQTNLWKPETNNDAIWWIVGFTIVVSVASILFLSFRRRRKRHHISRHHSFQRKNEKIKK